MVVYVRNRFVIFFLFYIFGFRFGKKPNYTYPKELRKNFTIIAKETIAICKMVHINVYFPHYFLVMKPYQWWSSGA
jgi:hypothetical protein